VGCEVTAADEVHETCDVLLFEARRFADHPDLIRGGGQAAPSDGGKPSN
jgi:hypothetical protein